MAGLYMYCITVLCLLCVWLLYCIYCDTVYTLCVCAILCTSIVYTVCLSAILYILCSYLGHVSMDSDNTVYMAVYVTTVVAALVSHVHVHTNERVCVHTCMYDWNRPPQAV